jgi:hypothetical protein
VDEPSVDEPSVEGPSVEELLAQIEELQDEVAECTPLKFFRKAGRIACVFCNAEWSWQSMDTAHDPNEHEQRCTWRLAKRLMEGE